MGGEKDGRPVMLVAAAARALPSPACVACSRAFASSACTASSPLYEWTDDQKKKKAAAGQLPLLASATHGFKTSGADGPLPSSSSCLSFPLPFPSSCCRQPKPTQMPGSGEIARRRPPHSKGGAGKDGAERRDGERGPGEAEQRTSAREARAVGQRGRTAARVAEGQRARPCRNRIGACP
jgi:hypothetical protein